MGFYHSTTVLYGSCIVTDNPYSYLAKLETEGVENTLNKWKVWWSLNGAADSQELYLSSVYKSLDIGETFTSAGYEEDALYNYRHNLRECAKELDLEIFEPGWVTIHNYA
jgi:hypothetical protein